MSFLVSFFYRGDLSKNLGQKYHSGMKKSPLPIDVRRSKTSLLIKLILPAQVHSNQSEHRIRLTLPTGGFSHKS